MELYQGLADQMMADTNESDAVPFGYKVILPSTFQGSPRNMRERYHDAMTIVQQFGPPDIFLTMTCNPRWHEIVDNLYPGQSPSDRPDLVARVFNLKLKALMQDICMPPYVFGKPLAFVYTVEFQKRGNE